jgi:hypothetical protein
MLKLKGTFRALAAAGGIAVVALASVPALASSGHAAKSITGPEVIAGTVHGKKALANAPVMSLKLTGVVAAHSSINLGGSGPGPGSTKTFKTSAGKLTVKITAKQQTTQSLNPRTCLETFANYVVVSVVGGKSTGAFAGASGPGAAQIFFRATAPRFTSGPHKGQCNPNGQPKAKGAFASFLGSLVVTTK